MDGAGAPAPARRADLLLTRRATGPSQYGSVFRVRISMFWYMPDGGGWRSTGTATNEVDWYRKIHLSNEFGDDIATLANSCPDYYPG